jgi:hypothetical protein
VIGVLDVEIGGAQAAVRRQEPVATKAGKILPSMSADVLRRR